MDSCTKHPHEPGRGVCGRCGLAWCGSCLVQALGPKKPPYCMECAMFAAGVRSTPTRPAVSRRELKRLQKAAKQAPAGREDEPAGDDPAEPESSGAAAATEVPPAAAPAEAATDWDRPWWEDHQPALAD